MAQVSENFVFRGDYDYIKPKASTDINPGDAVMRQAGVILPVTADMQGYMDFFGICDDKWNSTVAIETYGTGTTEYTSPSEVRLKVYKSGIFKLAIRETSGTAGQAVYIQDGTSGSQVFTIDPQAGEGGGPIGYLYEDFSGASANDPQKVRIVTRDQVQPPDIRHYLLNHVIQSKEGTFTAAPAYHTDDTTQIATFAAFMALVKGNLIEIASGATGTVEGLTDVAGHQVIIWALTSDGSVKAFVDPAKATDYGSGTLKGDSIYWPSVTIDYLPFAIMVAKHSASVLPSAVSADWVVRSIADCLKVT